MVALAQVRIESAAKLAAKVAAASAGMSQEAWITAAINEKLSAAHYADRLAKMAPRCEGCHEAIIAGRLCDDCKANSARVATADEEDRRLGGIGATQS